MVIENIDPESLIDNLTRYDREAGTLNVFWICVTGERSKFCSDLCLLRKSMPIIPIVIRERIFEAPNAIFADLAALIDANRSAFDHLADATFADICEVSVVLISLLPLATPQLGSPAILPLWFQRYGGLTVRASIVDLTAPASCLLNAEGAHVADISARLFDVDQALLRRIAEVHNSNHNSTNALTELIKTQDEKINDILELARTTRASIQGPSAFRPSTRNPKLIIERLLRLYSSTAPDRIGGPAKALASSISATDEVRVPDSMFSIVMRPTLTDSSQGVKFSRSLLVNLYCAYQLTTAAAHADYYGYIPIVVVRASSYDIRRVLAAFCTSIDSLPQLPPGEPRS